MLLCVFDQGATLLIDISLFALIIFCVLYYRYVESYLFCACMQGIKLRHWRQLALFCGIKSRYPKILEGLFSYTCSRGNLTYGTVGFYMTFCLRIFYCCLPFKCWPVVSFILLYKYAALLWLLSFSFLFL